MAQTNQRDDKQLKQLNVLAQPWFPSRHTINIVFNPLQEGHPQSRLVPKMMSDRVAYDVLQMTMARQRVTVYDLYGLLGVSPNVDEDGLRAAYDAITEKHQQVPSDVVNAAYSVLSNPFKRAQYDRDRLEYLYRQFGDHEAFPPTARVPSANVKGRDDQIQVYTATLAERVRDPAEDRRRAIARRIDTVRRELDEFNERSGRQRQDWATSANRVLRMAGNALCEVVVCAEDDLRMLEDELGRADGRLSPREGDGDGLDGPAGRVTSCGYYGSDIMAMPTGTMADNTTGIVGPNNTADGNTCPQPRVLMARDVPRIPRSPTVRFLPQSASKLGIDAAAAAEYTPSSEGSQAAREAQANVRVTDFLLLDKDKAGRRVSVNNLAARPLGPTLMESLGNFEGLNLERVGMDHPDNINKANKLAQATNAGGGGAMGLVAWQRINNNNPSTPDPQQQQQQQSQRPVPPPQETNKRSKSHPGPATATDLSAYNKAYDPASPRNNRTHSADDQQPRAARDPRRHEALFSRVYRGPEYRDDEEEQLVHGDGARVPAWPAWRHSTGATAALLSREAGDSVARRAWAGEARRWVVGGEGLTTYAGRGPAEKEGRGEDPFA